MTLALAASDRLVARHLVRDGVGRAQILLDQAEDFLLKRGVIRDVKLARLLRRFLGELDDRIDHRLEMLVAEHDRAEHHVFGQFLGFRLDHQHGVGGAGDDEIELAFGHLVDLRIEHDIRC